jgi:hypothetical protein
MAEDAVQSIASGSTATTTVPVVLDNFDVKTTHTMVVTAAASTSGGVVSLQVSQDGTNWFSTAAAALTAAGVTSTTVTGAFRYVQAKITTAITGGSVGVTVNSH